jgi:hypothetical protein
MQNTDALTRLSDRLAEVAEASDRPMTDHLEEEGSQLASSPALAAAAYVQAWESVRHIRNERIWFTNAYSAIVAGSLAVLVRDSESFTSRSATVGLVILVLFSFASLLSSIRLVAELRNSIANVQRAVDETGMGRMVGTIEPLSGFGAWLPMRWMFPIYFSLSTAALLVLFVVHLLR